MRFLRWNAMACKLQVVEITKLNIVKQAYCQAEALIRKCQCSDPVYNT